MIAAPIQASTANPDAFATLEKAAYFLTADGSDVLIEPGTYQIEAAHPWIRLIPKERRDALLLAATIIHHDENMVRPVVNLTVESNQQSIRLLMPGGEGFESSGTVNGIRSRAVTRSRIAKSSTTRKTASRQSSKKHTQPSSKNITIQKLTHRVSNLETTIHALQTRLVKLESIIQVNSSGTVTINSPTKIKLNASTVEVSSGIVKINSGMAKFSGVVQSDTVITNSIVSSSYTPGAGNVW